MAAVTVTEERVNVGGGRQVVRYSGTGAANTDATLTTTAVPKHKTQKLAYAVGNYGSAVTQTGVTMAIDNVLGSAFDFTFFTGTADTAANVYVPDRDIYLLPGDAFAVTCLAGGSGDIASLQVVVEEY
jgi:hypothetical protein